MWRTLYRAVGVCIGREASVYSGRELICTFPANSASRFARPSETGKPLSALAMPKRKEAAEGFPAIPSDGLLPQSLNRGGLGGNDCACIDIIPFLYRVSVVSPCNATDFHRTCTCSAGIDLAAESTIADLARVHPCYASNKYTTVFSLNSSTDCYVAGISAVGDRGFIIYFICNNAGYITRVHSLIRRTCNSNVSRYIQVADNRWLIYTIKETDTNIICTFYLV